MVKIVLVTGPSSVGKSTLVDGLIRTHTNMELIKSVTTREMGEGETEGSVYYFIETSQFESMIEADEFLEWDTNYGNSYGTTKKEITRFLKGNGLIGTKAINVSMALNLKKIYGKQLIVVFLKPNSLKDLEYRIMRRGRGESSEAVTKRLKEYDAEMDLMNQCDYVLLANTPEQTLDEANEIIKKIIG